MVKNGRGTWQVHEACEFPEASAGELGFTWLTFHPKSSRQQSGGYARG